MVKYRACSARSLITLRSRRSGRDFSGFPRGHAFAKDARVAFRRRDTSLDAGLDPTLPHLARMAVADGILGLVPVLIRSRRAQLARPPLARASTAMPD
jgi:hypothetical protein